MMSFTGSGGTGINPNGLTIMKASYGLQNTFVDVTKEVQQLFQNGELNFTVSAQSLGILDPAPGVTKTLQIQHAINGGHPQLMTKNDGEQVLISVPTVKTPDEKTSIPTFFGSIWYGVAAAIITIIAMSFYASTVKYWGPDPSSTAGTVGSILFFLAIVTYGHLFWFAVPIIIGIGIYYGMPTV
jgi:hypothetical protein